MEDMSQAKKSKVVALVGHCGPDSSFLRMAVSGAAPGTRVVLVDSDEDLEAVLQEEQADLLMLNRRLDYGFETSDGMSLLVQIREKWPRQKVMMITNYPDAQQAAESAGALPGFGKREIGSDRARQRITVALNGAE